MGAYSFLDIRATLIGPGVTTQIGSTAGDAKEGIETAFDEEKDTTTTGADGEIMHSLHAGQTGTWTVRLLKTSPVNAALNQAYNFQRTSAANWGQNMLRLVDKVRGDVIVLREAAFVKHADNAYSEEGNIRSWQFRGIMFETDGAGTPSLSTP